MLSSAKLPREGDEGLSDTVKQMSLLLGTYSLKLADFVKEKDAEGEYSRKLLASVKDGMPFLIMFPCIGWILTEISSQPSSKPSPLSSRREVHFSLRTNKPIGFLKIYGLSSA